jgi:(2Fe-2S) ferredoxin
MSFDPTIPVGNVPKTDTAAHLLICVGPRCAANGAALMFQEVWESLDAEKLAYYRTGGSIRLTESGCLGACDFGPTVACYHRSSATDATMAQTWRIRMTTETTVSLARAVHIPTTPGTASSL